MLPSLLVRQSALLRQRDQQLFALSGNTMFRIIEQNIVQSQRETAGPLRIFIEQLAQEKMITLQGMRVARDVDLAELFGLDVQELREEVKQNTDRFPSDFMVRLGDGSYAFSEPGIIAAESPNPIVNQLVIMPDIEKRLEAFVRLVNPSTVWLQSAKLISASPHKRIAGQVIAGAMAS